MDFVFGLRLRPAAVNSALANNAAERGMREVIESFMMRGAAKKKKSKKKFGKVELEVSG